jgi:hypothetical protein
MINPATGILTSYEEIWRDEEHTDAVFVRNAAGSVWRARAGPWQLALGRNAVGEFWAWQAQKNASEEVWTRRFSTHLGVGSEEYLPEECLRWEQGSAVEWGGERWLVLN